jgi:NAD+ synthase
MNPTPTLNIVLCQLNPTVGDLQGNMQRILTERTKHPTADLLIFPECFLTGYPLQDLVNRPIFAGEVVNVITAIATEVAAQPGPSLLFGAPTPTDGLPYNSAVLIHPNGDVACTHKQKLPNNEVFDEVRVFAPYTEEAHPLTFKGHKLGVLICEDAWHPDTATELAKNGAECLIVINGSPTKVVMTDHGLGPKHTLRLSNMRQRVTDTGLPLLYLNLVGGQDDLVFDGHSFILNAAGEETARLPFLTECITTAQIVYTSDGCDILCPEYPATTPLPSAEEVMYRAAVLGLRDYLGKQGITRVVLGVSGGADSALVAAMAADAIGADGVQGVMLPSDYTSTESTDLAADLCQRMGIKLDTFPISATAKVFEETASYITPRSNTAASLAAENLQARIRMAALMYYANAQGGMMLCTSNKSESSIGYGTIYGDIAGGYNPIKDIYKTEVWNLMRWRNENIPADSRCPVASPIPEGCITRPPSAELKPNQVDADALGEYTLLDTVLQALVEDELDVTAATLAATRKLKVTVDPAYVTRMAALHFAQEYKRRQSAPGPQLRDKGYGLARRYPLVNRYRGTTVLPQNNPLKKAI